MSDKPMTDVQAARIRLLHAEVRQGWADLAKTVGVQPWMAEVLRTHTRRPGIRGLAIHCECGWSESILKMRSSKGSFAAHQADMLAAAGFGKEAL